MSCPQGAEYYRGRRISWLLAPLKAELAACSGNGYLTPLRPPQSGENPRGRVNTKTNFYFNKVNSLQCDTEGEGFSPLWGEEGWGPDMAPPLPHPPAVPTARTGTEQFRLLLWR